MWSVCYKPAAFSRLTSLWVYVQFNSVQSLVVSDSLGPHELQHARPPCPTPTPGAYPNSWPLSRWCYPTISSSVITFSSCPQSFPPSGSFQMSQHFGSGGQSIGVSASTLDFQWTPRTDLYVQACSIAWVLSQLFVTLQTVACQVPLTWDSPGKNTRVSCHALLQGIFPTQGSKVCLLHYRQILYHWATRAHWATGWALMGIEFHNLEANASS